MFFKLLILAAFFLVAYALLVGRARRRGNPSKEADRSYILLATTARYFLYVAGAIVVLFSLAVAFQVF